MKSPFVVLFVIIFTMHSLPPCNAQVNEAQDSNKFVPQKFDLDALKGVYATSIEEVFKSRSAEEEAFKNYQPVLLSDYFLLGCLNAYFERPDSTKKYKSSLEIKPDEVDVFWKEEAETVKQLAKYIQDTLGIKTHVKTKNNGHSTLCSDELARRLNTYFNGQRSLKDSIFENSDAFCSYLAGCYFRNGINKGDHQYQIGRFYLNSNQLFSLLRREGCRQICYQHIQSVPGDIRFTFEASVKIEKYFESTRVLKSK